MELTDLLDEVSDFYDGEIEYDLNRLTESIEPILIIFIATLVLVLALAVPADLGFRRYLAGISSEFLCPGRCSVLSGINISRKAAKMKRFIKFDWNLQMRHCSTTIERN